MRWRLRQHSTVTGISATTDVQLCVKMGNKVAAAVVHGNVTKTTRLPNKASIFRAELHTISLALSLIRRSKEKNFIIFLDSMSSLEAISGFKLEIDIVHIIIKDYTNLANTGKTIIL